MPESRKPAHRRRERADIIRNIFENGGDSAIDDDGSSDPPDYSELTPQQRHTVLSGTDPFTNYRFTIAEYFDAVEKLGVLVPSEIAALHPTINRLIAERRNARVAAYEPVEAAEEDPPSDDGSDRPVYPWRYEFAS